MSRPALATLAGRAAGLFLAACWVVTVALATVGAFLVDVKNLLVYGLLFLATIFIPPLGLLLVACMFLHLTRPYWDRHRSRTETIP